MIITTNSSRLAIAARLCRLLPPMLSAKLQLLLYPLDRVRRENASFSVRSTLADVRFEYARGDLLAVSFAVRGFYEWRTITIANAICRTGDCIVEVGSNIGTETVLFAKIVGSAGKVIAFEPFPEAADCLQRMATLNELTQIEIHRLAVSDRAGSCSFQLPTDSLNCGTGSLVSCPEGDNACIQVKMVTLDQFADEGRVPAAKLIVMDVEGAELQVLRGATRFLTRHEPCVLLEVNGERLPEVGQSAADVDDFFRERGYSRWLVKSTGLKRVDRNQSSIENWLCIPRGDSAASEALRRSVSRRILRALVTPPIRHLNPAVIDGR